MHHSARFISKTFPACLFLPLLAWGAPCAALASTAAPVEFPGSPAGALARQVIDHLNGDTPAQLRHWAPTVLASSMDEAAKSDFVANLQAAGRDAGGVDVVDVQTSPRQPGTVQVTLKGRRLHRYALLALGVDASNAGKLVQADMMPMDDPTLYAAWPRVAIPPKALQKLLHDTLDTLAGTADFSGCLSVYDGHATIFDECRGKAERNFAVPADTQTRFHIGSMDKMFTAVAIAQLVEQGKLGWGDTLARLVPEFPDQEAARNITVWQLLHHTSGLGDFLVPEYFGHKQDFIEPADYLGLIARQPRATAPGKQWSYSNAGYMLLGRIIENVSGERYVDYVQRHVFAPAGMGDTGFDVLDAATPGLAVGYYRESVFSPDWKAAWLKLGLKGGPAGGGYSTNADLLAFAKALQQGVLLRPAALAHMFEDEVPAGPGGYAAGFGDRLSHGRHIRGHAGSIEGTTANLQMVWETQAAIALTSNEGPSDTWMLVEHIADLLAANEKPR